MWFLDLYTGLQKVDGQQGDKIDIDYNSTKLVLQPPKNYVLRPTVQWADPSNPRFQNWLVKNFF